ncbi:Type II secretion system protein E [Prochlorococcus marinus str. MIT 1313]|uniref:GspE/PulE family protein n=1 Tax=Prochlorococcus TaxID=1218 RepID=UPI0007B38373|nr:GspE/PulE family protein [Prochlorococcus marinus]KZR68743.1 Type II secretion system protein E [Prochlorococcus marinus str. MIT 1313]
MNKTQEIRKIIDKYFSLAWCRENIVIPLGVETAAFPNKQRLTVAVGNFSYLATIGEFIKKRAADANLECVFIEKPADQIQALLDEAATQRLISGEGLENYDYSDDAILEALKAAEDDQNPVGFDFDFDDSKEAQLIDEALDLSAEMLGSKIQQAAANILIHSTRTNVSDIHIEPRLEEYKIRVRRDGVMQDFVRMPRSAGIKLTACLKNMAEMDIAERRASQDGKIFRRFEGQRLEFRCSTAPGKHGEKMVLRILNSDEGMLSLDILITNEEIKKNFRRIIEEANGIVIVSGPTGSGKSTTLASALREKDTGELNIVTAEDPIEYDLGGNIQQFPVMRAKGQTFANLLRTFLRQDPDVILIGETRDPETAESSMDAAETGHLVFTTLHANSASTSLTRLLDMEVPSYKLTASLRGVLAQRLLRKVCPECSSKRPIDDLESRFTGLRRGTEVRVATALKAEEKEQRKREGTLCTRCSGTGYKGRIGTYELMRINRRISDAIKQKKSTREIEDIAVEDGMLTLKAYAVDLIKNQLTTVSELQKICNTEY